MINKKLISAAMAVVMLISASISVYGETSERKDIIQTDGETFSPEDISVSSAALKDTEVSGAAVESLVSFRTKPMIDLGYAIMTLNSEGKVHSWGLTDHTGEDYAGLQIVSLSSGYTHTMALDSSGKLYACGINRYGQLGNGTNINSSLPVVVTGISDVKKFLASKHTGYGFSIAVKNDGTVWAWGCGEYGILGNGSLDYNYNVPKKIEGLSGIVDIAAGYSHIVALKNDGTVWTWGYNRDGQLGYNTTEIKSAVPKRVEKLLNEKIIKIAADGYGTYALANNGNLYSWGSIAESGSNTIPKLRLQNVSVTDEISTNYTQTIFCHSDGTVSIMGKSIYDNLFLEPDKATGKQVICDTPVKILSLSNISSVAMASDYYMALCRDGSIYAWGWNAGGQLGDGTTIDRITPVKVLNINLGSTDSASLLDFNAVTAMEISSSGVKVSKYNGTLKAVTNAMFNQTSSTPIIVPVKGNFLADNFKEDMTHLIDTDKLGAIASDGSAVYNGIKIRFVRYGDVDSNGTINAVDFAKSKAAARGLLNLDLLQSALADIDGNKAVNAVDFAQTKAKARELLNEFTIEKEVFQ